MTVRRRPPRPWTKPEDYYLSRQYGRLTIKQMATATGRSEVEVVLRLRSLGLTSPSSLLND